MRFFHRIFRTLRTAIRALSHNVMRSALTTLGIIIGVSAVIAMMEIGNGTSAQMAQKIASLGANSLTISPGNVQAGGVSAGIGAAMSLTPQDCDAIIRDCTAIRGAAPIVYSRGVLVYGSSNYMPNSVYGTTPDYLTVREWPLDDGVCFSDQDVRSSALVCLIGHTIVDQLFGREDPLGKSVRLGIANLRVVGVLGHKGSNMWGQDQDDVLIAPWTTIKFRISSAGTTPPTPQYQQLSTASSAVPSVSNSSAALYPNSTLQLFPAQSTAMQADKPLPVRFTNINQILAGANSQQEIDLAIEQIDQLLRERHHLRPDQIDDFTIRDMTEIGNVFSSTTKLMSILLLVVALISLVVGGVGIMNIMLVSVTERTREIGLRMAVGARSRDILSQFLIEAVLLCLLGGAIGILLGIGAGWAVHHFLNWAVASSTMAIVVSVLVSGAVGVGFGFYPAWKASSLDPIEALRYE